MRSFDRRVGVETCSRRRADDLTGARAHPVSEDPPLLHVKGCAMKAARFSRFGGPEVLEIVDLPDPDPGRGEIRIRVRAAGVNASD
jgi:hypothetical protein